MHCRQLTLLVRTNNAHARDICSICDERKEAEKRKDVRQEGGGRGVDQ